MRSLCKGSLLRQWLLRQWQGEEEEEEEEEEEGEAVRQGRRLRRAVPAWSSCWACRLAPGPLLSCLLGAP